MEQAQNQFRANSLSIVATLYRSEHLVEEFVRKATCAADALGLPYEIVLVNDGSPDSSLQKVLDLQSANSDIVVVNLSRNFGHHPAILAGLGQAKGDLIFLIDSDLEEDPAWLCEFSQHMNVVGADVVFGQQRKRKGGWFEAVSGRFFYAIFNLLSDTRVPVNFVTARLMTRQYVDALLDYEERAVFLGGTFVLAGFNQVPCPIEKGARLATSYSLSKRLHLFVDALTSFSVQPLNIVFGLGSVVTLFSVAGVIYVLVKAFTGSTLVGWASLVVSIWLFGGLTLFSVGLVGIYVAKVLLEAKRRPLFKVRSVHGLSKISDSRNHEKS